ncbi:MAG: hypothetical protein ACPG5T_10440, partial [Endozoicomonas sp.]
MSNAPEQSRGSENRLDMIEGDLAEVMHDGAEKGNQALVIAGGRLSTWPRLEGRALSSINSLLTLYHIDLAGLMKQHTPKSIDSVVAIDLPENLLRLKKLVIVPVDSGASSTEDLCRQYRKAGKALCEPEKGSADWHVVVLPPATSDRFIQEGCDGFSACAKEVAGLSSGQGVTIVCPPQSDVLSTLNAYGLASGTSLPKADPADGSGYQASGGVAETKGANQMDVVGFKGTTSFNARNDALIQHIAALQTGTRFTAFDLKQYLLDLMGLKKSTPGVDEAVDKVLTNMYDLLRRCKGGEKRLKGKLECYKAIFNQVQAWLLQEPRFDL